MGIYVGVLDFGDRLLWLVDAFVLFSVVTFPTVGYGDLCVHQRHYVIHDFFWHSHCCKAKRNGNDGFKRRSKKQRVIMIITMNDEIDTPEENNNNETKSAFRIRHAGWFANNYWYTTRPCCHLAFGWWCRHGQTDWKGGLLGLGRCHYFLFVPYCRNPGIQRFFSRHSQWTTDFGRWCLLPWPYIASVGEVLGSQCRIVVVVGTT
jgi:hypothetical protein